INTLRLPLPGDLRWYQYFGNGGLGRSGGPTIVGHGGWDHYRTVFGDFSGNIYGIAPGGELMAYRDNNRDGSTDVTPPGGINVGDGWAPFSIVFSGGDGTGIGVQCIYGVDYGGDGNVWRYDENWNGTGRVGPSPGYLVGQGGWQIYRLVFA